MSRYAKGIKLEDHIFSDVIKSYGAKGEVEFVNKFFKEEEMNAILEACGFNPVKDIDRTLEHKVKIGTSTKRADLTFQNEDDLFYFEVADQSGSGKWDTSHHEQIMTKTFKFGLEYGLENVHTFAIAFKEFDPMYLEDIQKWENAYAVHLRFNDTGYYADVYGAEEKKTKKTVKLASVNKLAQKLMAISLSFGWDNRNENPCAQKYCYIGKGINGTKYGLEWVASPKNDRLGIKLTGGKHPSSLNAPDAFYEHFENPDKTVNFLKKEIPNFKSYEIRSKKDPIVYFEFDSLNDSNENLEFLKNVTMKFAEFLQLSDLID